MKGRRPSCRWPGRFGCRRRASGGRLVDVRGIHRFSLVRGPHRANPARPHRGEEGLRTPTPGLLRLVERVVDTLLAGEHELQLLVEAAHQVLGLRQAHELVRGIPLLVDVEGRLEQRVTLAEVRLGGLVAGETVRQRAQLAFACSLIRNSTSLNASALCSVVSEIPMPQDAYGMPRLPV